MSDLTFKCLWCNQDVTVDEQGRGLPTLCPHCGDRIIVPLVNQKPTLQDARDFTERVSARISDFAGVEQLEDFSLKETFSEVFSRHSDEEVEEYFAIGGPSTTPSRDMVDTSWPKPWLFFRAMFMTIIGYACFAWAWHEFRNIILIPGLIFVGSFAVPFSALLFFFESNTRRNVSLFQIVKLVFIGIILSFVVSLISYRIIDVVTLRMLEPILAAFAEEPSKLLALLVVVNNKKYPYILNGLLFGAAIGAGFAAFESAGYAFFYAIESGPGKMHQVILVRGMLSPFTHIVWTSMCAAALWRVKGGSKFSVTMLGDMRFLRVLFAAVLLHTVWNSGIVLPFYGKYIILGVFAWVIIFGLLQEGLKQLRAEISITTVDNMEEVSDLT